MVGWFHRLANPNRFLQFAMALEPWAAATTIIFFSVGLCFSLFLSPADYQQGETVRIMYVHVPSAWMALFCYTGMAISSGVYIIWKHPLASLIAKETAPIGACFAFLALVTGSLWGQPMWGTWWVWDARLTSMLILLFLYIGYIALHDAFDDPYRGANSASVLALVGFINVPVIKFSVDWWNTLHQPASVFKMSGPSIHTSMLTPLLLMAIAFKAYYIWVLFVRVRCELLTGKLIRDRQRRRKLGS